MKAYVSFGRIKTEKLGYSAALLSVLITITFVVLLMQGSSLRLPLLSLQVSIHTFVPKPAFMEESIVSYNKQVESKSKLIYVTQMANVKQGQNHINVSSLKQKHVVQSSDQERNYVIGSHSQEGNDTLKVDSKSKLIYVTQMASVKQGQNHRNVSSLEHKHVVESSDQERNHVIGSLSQEENDTLKGVTDQTSSIICDFSESRSDTCYMLGDVRVLSSSSSILLVSTSSQPPSSSNNSSQSIKPYARKWEPQSMQNIKELHLRTSSKQQQSPDCNLKHTVPGIIFSTGGFLGNFFHDFTDVIIPLFVTSRQYMGEVQFLVTDYNARWITKYKSILQRLSRFDIINMDIEKNIHCFPSVHIGLKSHKVLGIETSKTPKGYSMTDFKKFLRETFSLKRGIIQMSSRRKPRLLMISREGSRTLLNEKEVAMMARRIGYKVIIARPQDMKELPRFAETVNSCDVMVGVHGAGLANMVFMPENSTVIQIIPWGGLTWACRHDYGEPAPDMGIKYLEYEITEYESSLIKEYPKDHAVFKDPLSIHRQGWNTLWSIFLNKQKIKLDVARFKNLLLNVYRSLKQ